MTLKFLLEKEFKQFFRNQFMPKMVVAFPLLVMLVMPWSATLDIKDIKVSIVDGDHSPLSRRFIDNVDNSTYFDVSGSYGSYSEALTSLEFGNSDMIVEVPTGFENDLVNLGTAPVQISVNAVNSIKGSLGQAYMTTLIMDFNQEIAPPQNGGLSGGVSIEVLNMYNPGLDYKKTMIPGLMTVIMLLLCGFLPAVNIVNEKEMGTIEQMNVTPVSKAAFILAKLIPFWIIGLLALTFAFILAWLIYGLTPAGNYFTMYLFSLIFIFTMTGLGLVISNHSSTMQQATFVMFFFVIIFVMLCGLLTPVSSMPGWARVIAGFTPTKYIVDVMRSVYLRGSGVVELMTEAIILSAMMVVYNVWAVVSYRKYS